MPSPKTSEAGLKLLRSLQPDANPGAAPGRLHGRYATCVVSGVTMLCYEWEVTFTQEFADGTAHGDFWDFPVPLKQMWTARARGYFTAAGAATTTYLYANSKISGDPATVSFIGYSTPGTTTKVFEGVGYASRGNFTAPQGMATQEVELRGYGAPTIGVTA